MDPWEPIPADMPGWVRRGVSLNQRYYHVWDPLRRNLGYTRRFAERMNLSACTPHPELCTSTYCLANPGHEYLCFFPAGGTEGLDPLGGARHVRGGVARPRDGRTGNGSRDHRRTETDTGRAVPRAWRTVSPQAGSIGDVSRPRSILVPAFDGEDIVVNAFVVAL